MRGRRKFLSPEFCEKNQLTLISESEGKVEIGYVQKPSDEICKRIERYFQPEKDVSFFEIRQEEFDVRLRRLYSGGEGSSEEKEKGSQRDVRKAAEAAPAVNLLYSIVSEGILKGATDIHIEMKDEGMKVRYRKDGRLYFMLEADKERGEAVIARIKLLSDLNIMEHRRCQDGRFSYCYKESAYDLRVSVIAGVEGESVVIRILGGDIKAPYLDELGFTENQLKQIRKLMAMESGLVLASGPTGSGKTTTLASIITELNRDDINIITVEDPVEYRIKGVLQINVDEEIGRSFSEVLKRLLRHDPDILMIGEVRDEKTASIACRMALTGHLVFASIHTANIAETPLRLTDMGVPEYVVKAVLKGVISQRLVERKEGGRKVKADIKIFDEDEKK